MVRQSWKGDTEPYSAWHRTLGDWLTFMDMDAIESQTQPTLSLYIEANKDDYRPCAFIEVININGDCGGELPRPPSELYKVRPIDTDRHKHKKKILENLNPLVNVPVFIVWVAWDSIERDGDGVIAEAVPKAFYVREVGSDIGVDMTPKKYRKFLRAIRGLPVSNGFEFECLNT